MMRAIERIASSSFVGMCDGCTAEWKEWVVVCREMPRKESVQLLDLDRKGKHKH